jgi:hypothetical protein
MALEEEDAKMSGEFGKPIIKMSHLTRAIDGMERQITPEMLEFYASYQGK